MRSDSPKRIRWYPLFYIEKGNNMSQRINVLYQKKPCYDIVITRDFNGLTEELELLQLTGKKIAIITDTQVGPIYSQEVKELLLPISEQVSIFEMPAGEANKTLDTVKSIYTFLIQEGFGRKDLLIALGGGVVGDVTGYAAATYMRGIDFIQMPTTLLSQNDSSIGGKTGVDFDGYKNMVGAFKMPRLVYMNLNVLTTLDDRQYFSGFAEVMKHGLIKDSAFYTWLIENMYEICERDLDILEEMIFRSCNIKKTVVEKDPTEQGDRALLNFGHTIGHAIEKYMNFELTHGECISLGAVAAAFISWKRNLISMEDYYEVRDMYVPFYLPISIDHIEPKEILQLTKSDKKAEGKKIKFILLKRIGKAVIDDTVTDAEILDAINEIYFNEEEDGCE